MGWRWQAPRTTRASCMSPQTLPEQPLAPPELAWRPSLLRLRTSPLAWMPQNQHAAPASPFAAPRRLKSPAAKRSVEHRLHLVKQATRNGGAPGNRCIVQEVVLCERTGSDGVHDSCDMREKHTLRNSNTGCSRCSLREGNRSTTEASWEPSVFLPTCKSNLSTSCLGSLGPCFRLSLIHI